MIDAESKFMGSLTESIPALRVPPHSIEAESGVLGSLLLDNAAWDRVGDLLTAADFYRHENRLVYATVEELINAAKPADVITVHERLQARGQDDEAGGLMYLNGLTHSVSTAAHARRYAEIVRERSMRRRLIAAADDIAAKAFDPIDMPADTLIDEATRRIMALSADAPGDDWIDAQTGAMAHIEVLEARLDGSVKSWQTGLTDFDDMLDGGLRPGALVAIGARPGHGKTSLGMSIGLHMAVDYKVALMSMEMPHRDVRDRMISMTARVPLSSVIRPAHDGGLDWSRVTEGVETISRLSFFVSDQSGLTINQLRVKARKLKKSRGLDVLIVDYIGLMNGTDPKLPRTYQIEEITKGLKGLAKELNIVVLALAQLNRNIEQRANRRPMLSDFRDSGSIEQDADVVIGLHREFVDNPDIEPAYRDYADLSILKNRQGRTGKMGLHYDGPTVKFSGWGGPPPTQTKPKRTKVSESF